MVSSGVNSNLLQGLRQKDRAIIEALYTSCFPQIRDFILKNSGNQADAEDLFQDAMYVLYKNAGRPDFELTVQPNTYLFAVARNLWLKKLRQKQRIPVTHTPADVSIDEEILEEHEVSSLKHRLYRKKFAILGTDCRKILSMFYDGTSMQSIAKSMGYASAGYAKKKKFTCKQKLMDLIRQDPLFKELSDYE